MKKVLLRGPVFSKSGYGEHTRQIYKYLKTKNVDVDIQPLNWGMTPWYLSEKSLDGLVGQMQNDCNFSQDKKYDVTIQNQLPNEWDPSLGTYNIGVTAGVETDKCNPTWVTLNIQNMNKVLVPSEFTKKTLLNSGVDSTTSIEVVPESYYEELVLENVDTLQSIKSLPTRFNFLTVGVLTGLTPESDRKNLFYLMKWFIEEFRNDKDVGLVIKTNKGRDTEVDKIVTTRILRQVLKELNYNKKPRVYLLHGEMSRKDMTSLYKSKKIKGYISATRGEGFGLPLLEAAVAGLPVLATNWSAHTEFLNTGKWISFDYNLKKVDSNKIDNNIFMPGARWAEVKETDFKTKIRNFYKKPGLPEKWASDLSKKLQYSHSIESIISKYDEVLGDILS
jgi:glycosyltransferase involved in cell wall biosynthesis